jgi:phenylalanine-4-hydroxylase
MKQNYANYTNEDFEVWKLLLDRQMPNLEKFACAEYLKALEIIGFSDGLIPDFSKVNKVLAETTGWSVEVVPGIIPPGEFFDLLRQKKFPSSTWIRNRSQIEYIEEPDMFHDAFGHLPLLTHKEYTGFFTGVATLAIKFRDIPEAIEMLNRLYWFTIEFGLMKDKKGEIKAYGAGLMSSSGEITHALGREPELLKFEAGTVLNTGFRNDVIQNKYFVIDSFDQLFKSIDEIGFFLEEKFRTYGIKV